MSAVLKIPGTGSDLLSLCSGALGECKPAQESRRKEQHEWNHPWVLKSLDAARVLLIKVVNDSFVEG